MCRAEMFIGPAAPAIECSGGDAPNCGKELSSKSGSRTGVSTQRRVVVRPMSMGFLYHGVAESFLVGRVAQMGVMGVESREGPCDKSLGVGE